MEAPSENTPYKIVAYLQAGMTYTFPGRNRIHAREIANRIITQGLWVTDPKGESEGTDLFYPTHLIHKVKAYPLED